MLFIIFNVDQFHYTWVIDKFEIIIKVQQYLYSFSSFDFHIFLELNLLPFLGTRSHHAQIITTSTVIRKQILLTAKGIQRISYAPGITATSVFMELALVLTNCQV